MPSKAAAPVTGRCYCGAMRLRADAPPQTVTYCHCADCRRWTGSPLPAFAPDSLHITPAPGPGFSCAPGVTRWTCADCGSPMAATFDYLPGQTYVPLGVLDQIDMLPPQGHAQTAEQVAWLHLGDDLPRDSASARARLAKTARYGE